MEASAQPTIPQRGISATFTPTFTASAATEIPDIGSGRLHRTRYALTWRPAPSAKTPGARASSAGTLPVNSRP